MPGCMYIFIILYKIILFIFPHFKHVSGIHWFPLCAIQAPHLKKMRRLRGTQNHLLLLAYLVMRLFFSSFKYGGSGLLHFHGFVSLFGSSLTLSCFWPVLQTRVIWFSLIYMLLSKQIFCSNIIGFAVLNVCFLLSCGYNNFKHSTTYAN